MIGKRELTMTQSSAFTDETGSINLSNEMDPIEEEEASYLNARRSSQKEDVLKVTSTFKH